MTENTEDIKFGLLFFKNDDEKNEFILKINEVIKQQKYKNKFLYEGNLIENVENIFIKNTFASWGEKTISEISDCKQLLETKKYRIIFKCIQTNIYYFEKNGAINCIDIVIKEYIFFNFERKLWNCIFDKNKNHNENVISYMNKYTKDNYFQDIQNINITYSNIINENIINIETFNYDYFNFFNLFNSIKEIDKEFKLPQYNRNNCIDENNKQSETIYNSLVFQNNPNKYILLDRKLIEGCEVADLYDKENRLLFHNKKSGDLRVLSLQIIIGALIMKNKNKNQQYINYLKNKGINETIDNNFIYVIGIIGNNIKIAQKDKISLGIVNYILRQHNIELYMDFINEL